MYYSKKWGKHDIHIDGAEYIDIHTSYFILLALVIQQNIPDQK